LQSTEKIQNFVAGGIVIAEGLRDGPRAEKLHQIRDALIKGDMAAIFSAVSAPRQYFQLNQVTNLQQLPDLPSSTRINDQSMFHNQHETPLVNSSDASSLLIHDQSAPASHDSRGRSRNRGYFLIPRARGRSDSPHRRGPTSIRDRDNSFPSRRSTNSQPESSTYDSANNPFTLARLGESDDEEYLPGNSDSDSDSLHGGSDTDPSEYSRDDESMEDYGANLSEDEDDGIPRGRGARLRAAINLSDLTKDDEDDEVDGEGIARGCSAHLQTNITPGDLKKDAEDDEDGSRQGVARGIGAYLLSPINIIDLTKDDEDEVEEKKEVEQEHGDVPIEGAVYTQDRSNFIDLTLDE
jgi:hypothetical protein